MKKLKLVCLYTLSLVASINGFAQHIIPFTPDYWKIENVDNDPLKKGKSQLVDF